MIRYTYDDKRNAVPAKPAAEPYPHRGTFTSAYAIGDRVSATYDIRTAPRRAGVVWGVLFHEEVGGDSVAYKIKMDDTGQFETWASGYVVPLEAQAVAPQMMVDTSAITESATSGTLEVQPAITSQWDMKTFGTTDAITLAIGDVKPSFFSFRFRNEGREVVSVDMDGNVTLSGDVNEASRVFWSAVGMACVESRDLVALIRQAEWSGFDIDYDGDNQYPACPWCTGRRTDGHVDDCPAARVLYSTEKP